MTYTSHREALEKHLKKYKFDPEWQNWVKTNIAAGCDKNAIFKILLDEGFTYNQIKEELNFEPAVPLTQLINPLKEPIPAQQDTTDTTIKKPDPLFIPNAQKLEKQGIEFFLLDDFLNAEECEKMIALIGLSLRPSGITSRDEPDKYYRTSRTCDLGLLNDPFVEDIDRRICAIMGIDPAYSEALQGQHYDVGQEFKAHTDFFEQNEMTEFGGALGQRSYTFMIYLNEVEDGGETSFPLIQQTLKPIRGQAVIWNNINPDGSPNHKSMHHAHPVNKGSKTVITKWFRTKNGLPVFAREANEYIINHTKIGFEKHRLPNALFAKITKFYGDNLGHEVREEVPGDFIQTTSKNNGKNAVGSVLIELSQPLRDEIHQCLKSELEAWSGIKLRSTYVYGIRIYQNGATLREHRDRIDSHIISAIINVDQHVNEDWPLVIEDNYYRRHDIILKPGDVVFYEGGRLLHGRPKPLNGIRYANVFCHFKPLEE